MSKTFNPNANRQVNLKTIVEKYEGTLAMRVARHLPAAIKNAEEKGVEYYIEDRGNEYNCNMPAFYSVNVKTGKQKELKLQKKNQYFTVNLGTTDTTSFQCPAYAISALAFIENPDPNKYISVDHIVDPDDSVLVYEIYDHYNRMEAVRKKSHDTENPKTWEGLEPNKISWSPKHLQWLTIGENTGKANTKEGKLDTIKFNNLIKKCDEQIKESAYKEMFDTPEKIKRWMDRFSDTNPDDHGSFIVKEQNKYLEIVNEQQYAFYEDNQIHLEHMKARFSLGEKGYVEWSLITNQCLYFSWIDIVDGEVDPFSFHEDENIDVEGKKNITVLDFVEKYVACEHMNEWDKEMWQNVIDWIYWASGGWNILTLDEAVEQAEALRNGKEVKRGIYHPDYEYRKPKLEIVGHPFLGPNGEWDKWDARKIKMKKNQSGWIPDSYLFHVLRNFCPALIHTEDNADKALFYLDRENFKLAS
tara:strand:- start:43 stop:1458 length:1416 start_codon:yes stop_codon:yes gene_type:complete